MQKLGYQCNTTFLNSLLCCICRCSSVQIKHSSFCIQNSLFNWETSVFVEAASADRSVVLKTVKSQVKCNVSWSKVIFGDVSLSRMWALFTVGKLPATWCHGQGLVLPGSKMVLALCSRLTTSPTPWSMTSWSAMSLRYAAVASKIHLLEPNKKIFLK